MGLSFSNDIGMEHINACIVRHAFFCICESGKKEIVKLIIFHIVIFNLSG